MRLLIMVLSFNEYPFSEFMKTQQETCFNNLPADVDVVYYYGNTGDPTSSQQEVKVNCTDDYNMMHWKFRLALDEVDYNKYDYIFRTNSCSYIDIDKIKKVLEIMPPVNCYGGYDNGGYISGAGIFFTPDVLDLLKENLTIETHYAEDVLFGEILKYIVSTMPEYSRIDAPVNGVGYQRSYHYRFKTSNDPRERIRDINNMKKLHLQLCKENK